MYKLLVLGKPVASSQYKYRTLACICMEDIIPSFVNCKEMFARVGELHLERIGLVLLAVQLFVVTRPLKRYHTPVPVQGSGAACALIRRIRDSRTICDYHNKRGATQNIS